MLQVYMYVLSGRSVPVPLSHHSCPNLIVHQKEEWNVAAGNESGSSKISEVWLARVVEARI